MTRQVVVVTGAAGFIGSNLVSSLAHAGEAVLAVDHAHAVASTGNLRHDEVVDVLTPEELAALVSRRDASLRRVRAIVHQGARTSTLDTDHDAVMAANVEYPALLLDHATRTSTPMLYASSAAVYGRSARFAEHRTNESPLNLYAVSKQRFDDLVRSVLPTTRSQVVGLRYFNVYGPREQHKGSMASMVSQMLDRALEGQPLELFGEARGCAAGEQRRDFVHVDDVVQVLRWFLDRPGLSGIYNCGTGRSRTFNDVARAVLAVAGGGSVRYVPFPSELQRAYQSCTVADLTRLRSLGCELDPLQVEQGVERLAAARRVR